MGDGISTARVQALFDAAAKGRRTCAGVRPPGSTAVSSADLLLSIKRCTDGGETRGAWAMVHSVRVKTTDVRGKEARGGRSEGCR